MAVLIVLGIRSKTEARGEKTSPTVKNMAGMALSAPYGQILWGVVICNRMAEVIS